MVAVAAVDPELDEATLRTEIRIGVEAAEGMEVVTGTETATAGRRVETAVKGVLFRPKCLPRSRLRIRLTLKNQTRS